MTTAHFMSLHKGYFRRLLIWGFLLSLLLGSFSTLSIGDRTPTLLYGDIYLMFLLFLFLLKLLIRGSRIVLDKPVFFLSALFFAGQILSLMINQSDIYRGVLSIKTFANGFLIYFIILSFCKTERDVDWVTYSLIFFTTIVALTLIFKYVVGFDLYRGINKDMIGIGWGYSNYLATILVFFAPVTLGLIISERRLVTRIVFVVCILLILFALIVTMSRGAMLSLTVVLGIVLPFLLRKKTKVRYIAILILVVGCIYYLATKVMPEVFIDRNIQLIEYRMNNPDYSRIKMMSLAWEDFLRNPLLGIGPFESYSQFFKYENMPHNFVLQNLAELGIWGGGAFILIITISLIRSYKICSYGGTNIKWKNENVYFFAAIITTLINGLMELTFQGAQYMSVFWIFMAVVTLKFRVFNPKFQSKIEGDIYGAEYRIRNYRSPRKR